MNHEQDYKALRALMETQEEVIADLRAENTRLREGVSMTDEEVVVLSATLHEHYERAAVLFGWKTQDECQVPYDALPEANRLTMQSAVKASLVPYVKQLQAERDELALRCEALERMLSANGIEAVSGCEACPFCPCVDKDGKRTGRQTCPTLDEAITGWFDRIRAERGATK